MLNYGDLIALKDQKGRIYVKKLEKGKKFHFYEGTIDCDDIVGLPAGCTITSSIGKKFLVYPPTLFDYIMTMPRKSNIIYPKDIGMILLWADIYPGCRVLTAGAGSGALLLALARAVGREGKVFGYDIREDMIEMSQKNIDTYLEENNNVILYKEDVYQTINETELDRILLDVPEPWHSLEPAVTALNDGGIILAYVPTIGQAEQFYKAIEKREDYVSPEVMEVLYRTWHISERSTRPDHRMVGHTGFLCKAVKINTNS